MLVVSFASVRLCSHICEHLRGSWWDRVRTAAFGKHLLLLLEHPVAHIHNATCWASSFLTANWVSLFLPATWFSDYLKYALHRPANSNCSLLCRNNSPVSTCSCGLHSLCSPNAFTNRCAKALAGGFTILCHLVFQLKVCEDPRALQSVLVFTRWRLWLGSCLHLYPTQSAT